MALIWTVLFVCLSLIAEISKAEDVFCGGLTVHKQQWLAKTVATISSQKTSDLKECLNICCSIPNCNAVTFMGFISNNSKETPSTNCLMFSCRENCVVVDRPSAAEGVVSVIINRAIPTSTTTLAAILPLTSHSGDVPPATNWPSESAVRILDAAVSAGFGQHHVIDHLLDAPVLDQLLADLGRWSGHRDRRHLHRPQRRPDFRFLLLQTAQEPDALRKLYPRQSPDTSRFQSDHVKPPESIFSVDV
uniref:MANSC domain-containing protein n=1 Tax=Panagrolaimus sp. JU765 TaxID=591449 RepID=A0AC34QKY8_9BILA